jgi:DNA-binding MarR family transcriptional regulator
MLTKQENEVMAVIFDLCQGKDSCLISPTELMKSLPEKGGYDEPKLNKILKSLELDDYFDIIHSDRKGEQIYCVSLHTKGFAYKRTTQQVKRNLYLRIALTVGFAILSFIVGRILIGLFS